jgi:hypothetical protein
MAVARFVGYAEVDGWIGEKTDKQQVGKSVAKELLQFYREKSVNHTFENRKEVEEFCGTKEGVRGVLIFAKLTKIEYKSEKPISCKEAKRN